MQKRTEGDEAMGEYAREEVAADVGAPPTVDGSKMRSGGRVGAGTCEHVAEGGGKVHASEEESRAPWGVSS